MGLRINAKVAAIKIEIFLISIKNTRIFNENRCIFKKDLTVFAGNIDGKEFNFTVEEFINLIGAFQKNSCKC